MDGITLDQHTLTLVKRQFTEVIGVPAEMLELDTAHGFFTATLMVRLRAAIYGEILPPHTETRTAYVPDGWWQHYRHDHADRWWMRRSVRRHPVRKRKIELTATWEHMAAYPWAQLRTQPVPGSLGDVTHLSWMTSTLTGPWTGNDDA